MDHRVRSVFRAAHGKLTPELRDLAAREAIRAGLLSARKIDLLAYAGIKAAQDTLEPKALRRVLGCMCSCRGEDEAHGHSALSIYPITDWLIGLERQPGTPVQKRQALAASLLPISEAARSGRIKFMGCYACESYFSKHAGSPCTCEQNRTWAYDTRSALDAAAAWLNLDEISAWEVIIKHSVEGPLMTTEEDDDWWVQLAQVITASYPTYNIQALVSSAYSLELSEKAMYQLASTGLADWLLGLL